MTLQVLNDDGSPLDAHFDLEGFEIIFHSRGGARSGSNVRNADYGPALRLLLDRLWSSLADVEGAWVDSNRVQALPLTERTILTHEDWMSGPANAFTLMSSRMRRIGRATDVMGQGGNTTKQIRIRLAARYTSDQLTSLLRCRHVSADFRSSARLPVAELKRVSAVNVWNAVQKLISGYSDHDFDPSTDFDLIADGGVRLAPKAVFGLATSEALGFPVGPKHFTGGLKTACFRMLRKYGYEIVPKDQPSKTRPLPSTPEDVEWAEGKKKLVQHLERERARGLAPAKKEQFRQQHGKLFCERCQMDPVAVYGSQDGEACIEVHHILQVKDMREDHCTSLKDLQCLCASCHRVVHYLLKKKLEG